MHRITCCAAPPCCTQVLGTLHKLASELVWSVALSVSLGALLGLAYGGACGYARAAWQGPYVALAFAASLVEQLGAAVLGVPGMLHAAGGAAGQLRARWAQGASEIVRWVGDVMNQRL
jgi:hypothetical protein